MRKSTMILTFLGIALYLAGMLFGTVQQQTQIVIHPSPIPSPTPLNINATIRSLEPDHKAVINFLTSPLIRDRLTADQTATLAREYLISGQTQDGVSFLTTAIQKYPSDPQLFRLLADAYHQDERYEDEREILLTAMPTNAEVWPRQRLIALNAWLGVPDSDQKIAYTPTSADDPYAQILIAGTLTDPHQQVEIIAANLLKAGEPILAEHVIERHYTATDHSDDFPMLAYLYAANGKTEQAKQLLEPWEATLFIPLTDPAAELVAKAYELLHDNESALRFYLDRNKLHPENRYWARAIFLLSAPKDPNTAIFTFLYANDPKIDLSDITALLNFCVDYPAFREDVGQRVVQMLTNFETLPPDTRLSLARFTIAGGEIEKGLQLLTDLVSEDSNSPTATKARWLRANTLLSTADTAPALAAEDLLFIIHQFPRDPFAALAERTYKSNFP